MERADLERFAWDELAEELVYPGAPEAELRVRLAMLRRRHGAGDGSVIRLGPLALDIDTYRVTAAGRPLDLTFKEFELLRFLASRPGRVFTRPALLREVWGYDFYGGTRTVDVHVRRLRAKLGPEHEHLVETVRGVGYRAADLDRRRRPPGLSAGLGRPRGPWRNDSNGACAETTAPDAENVYSEHIQSR